MTENLGKFVQKPPVKEKMTGFVMYAVFGLLLLNGLMYFQQKHMIFYPMSKLYQTPAQWGLDYEDVTLQTADNVQLHGWYIPHQQSEQVLLFFHGNAGNISHRRESIEVFHRLGLNVLIIDYRGYGKSKGSPSEQGLYKDADASWRFLIEEKGYAPEQILIFGRSLGGVVAAKLGSEVEARGLMLESTLSSAKDFARDVFTVLSRLVVMRYDFNTVEYVQHVSYPVVVLHSPDDDIMPFRLGEKVYQSANQPKQFIRMRGDHNYGFIQSQPEYEQQLESWLKAL
jgi:fermentation-respiration switch protein FrsA (DUF1100 family)